MDHETFVRLARSRDYLASALGERVTLADGAAVACLSPFHYHRQFQQAFGETPREFVQRLRLDRARQMLARTDTPVTDVCLAVGYESLGSFSTLFRNTTGHSPVEYRRAMRRAFPVPGVAVYRFVPTCFLWKFGGRLF